MAFVDFAAVKEAVSIEDAVHLLGLELKPSGSQLRGPCPKCQHGGDRALVVTPSKGLFVCFGAGQKCGGDQLSLVAHIAGLSVRDAAEWLGGTVTSEQETVTGNKELVSKKRATVPQAEKKTTREPTRAPFDPSAFAEKLEYGPEVEALGYTEQEAADFGIGSHRGAVYKAARYASGITAGYWKHVDGKWVAPKQWLPDASNVVQLKRA